MTANITHFGLTCWPGARASVGVYEMPEGGLSLTMYLDPVAVVVTVPPGRDGAARMARFCLELATQSMRLAARLDPEIAVPMDTTATEAAGVVRRPSLERSRHALRESSHPGPGGDEVTR